MSFVDSESTFEGYERFFVEAPDGGLVFKPYTGEIGISVTWEEYEDIRERFRQRRVFIIAIGFVILAAGMAFGIYHLARYDSVAELLIAFPSAFVLAVLTHAISGQQPIGHLYKRHRDEWLKHRDDDVFAG